MPTRCSRQKFMWLKVCIDYHFELAHNGLKEIFLQFVWNERNILTICLEGERNEMEMNEKNNIKIFFPSLVWEF